MCLNFNWKGGWKGNERTNASRSRKKWKSKFIYNRSDICFFSIFFSVSSFFFHFFSYSFSFLFRFIVVFCATSLFCFYERCYGSAFALISSSMAAAAFCCCLHPNVLRCDKKNAALKCGCVYAIRVSLRSFCWYVETKETYKLCLMHVATFEWHSQRMERWTTIKEKKKMRENYGGKETQTLHTFQRTQRAEMKRMSICVSAFTTSNWFSQAVDTKWVL